MNKKIIQYYEKPLSYVKVGEETGINFWQLRDAVRTDPSLYTLKKIAMLNPSVEYAVTEFKGRIDVETDYRKASVGISFNRAQEGKVCIHLHPNNSIVPSYADYKTAYMDKSYEAVFTKQGLTIYPGTKFWEYMLRADKNQAFYSWTDLRERFGSKANIFDVVRTLTAEKFPEWAKQVDAEMQANEVRRNNKRP